MEQVQSLINGIGVRLCKQRISAGDEQHCEIYCCNISFRFFAFLPCGNEDDQYETNLDEEPYHRRSHCAFIANAPRQAA